MGHSIGDALIVAALAAAFVAYLFFKHSERKRRLEIVHQERLVAMEKGIPLPELPLEPPNVPKPPDPREPLLHGIIWLAFGLGGMATLFFIAPPHLPALWSLPLPLALLGGGLTLYYFLATDRSR